MKKLILALAILLSAANAQAVETNFSNKYIFDKAHTNIIWFANHFGYSHPFGYFKDIDGYYSVDEKDLSKSNIDVTVKTASLTTPSDKFTEHLQSKDFFDAAKFPEAHFVSTKVDVTGKETADVTGNLTLHGVTKPIVLHVKLNKIGEHPFSHKYASGFSATAVIKRSEFGMGAYVPAVADEINLMIETEATREDAPAQK